MWCFRNRETGEITIAQAPNASLWIVILAGVLTWVWPSGEMSVIFKAVLKCGLFIWAADEVLRGVNPWRRCLGAAVLVYEAAMVISG